MAKAETKKLLENPNTPDAIAIEFEMWAPKAEITRRVAKHEQLTQLWDRSRNFFTDTVIVGTSAIVPGKGGVFLPYVVFKDGREMRMEFIPSSDRIDTGIGKGYVKSRLARVFDPVSGESRVYLVPGDLLGAINPYRGGYNDQLFQREIHRVHPSKEFPKSRDGHTVTKVFVTKDAWSKTENQFYDLKEKVAGLAENMWKWMVEEPKEFPKELLPL